MKTRTLCSDTQSRAASPFREPHTAAVGAKARSSIQSPPSLASPFGQPQPSSSGRGGKGAILVCAGRLYCEPTARLRDGLVAATGTACALSVVSKEQRGLCSALRRGVHPEGILLWLHAEGQQVTDKHGHFFHWL